MTSQHAKDPSPIDAKGLPELEARLREELAFLCYPGKDWVPQREGVTDVVIIGGGMCGMVAWLALTTAGIRNIRVLDRAEAGREGPWLNYARMETLRSPKVLTGPAFGMGSLTFQAWYRAQHGSEAWEALDKIPRPMWMDYLIWYRKALEIPVENGISVDHVEPEGDLLRLTLSGSESGSILTRKLIFATGRDGTGGPNIPGFVRDLPRRLWAHSADEIDFDALKDKRVAVIGVGASAVDNAAEALEHGAAEVRHLIRRKEMPTINKMMGIGCFGFTAGYPELPDEWRWRFMQYSFATQTPAPRGSTLRVSRHPNAYFHFGKSTTRIEEKGDAALVHFADGTSYEADYVILGTGFVIDPMARTEFGDTAGEILLWQDVYTPPEDEQSRDLGQFPYLNPDFTFREKTPGKAPWLRNVYCFNYGASASLGKISGDIPGISEGAAWLSRALAATLYREDLPSHWQGLQDYDTPELQGDEWRPSELGASQPEREDQIA
ncbi:NAD(P)-binding domain-containing protein [Frigidibacter sp. ROC022]|uniref:NAD(P)-binding domain-containing protein n=1 Tax=Frigidibacter sp. ROC022 TaxID=2971796 RepID=UPI00215A6A50|nr:NAD(P)/FAD-dependent oxidoreductase [Frigidibacter sp. ROC022]MCR8725806.1 NAD(P)/FAD-dependent oxidoreductase [Frigidibacter sp. ROC022]